MKWIIALFLCFLLPIIGLCSENNWVVQLKSSNELGYYGTICTYGIWETGLPAIPSPPPTGPFISCFDQEGFSYGCYKDVRRPYTNSYVWHLKLWVEPIHMCESLILTGWNPQGAAIATSQSVALEVVSGEPYRKFVFDGSAFGSSLEPLFAWSFDAKSHASIYEAIGLTLTVTPVPELSGLLVLLTGITTSATMLKRRRK